jgi:hypothetical protein
MLALALPCAAGDQIKVYTVPKEHSAIPVNSAPIHWTLPPGWTQKPADGIRLGSFAIPGEKGGQAEVAITSFPGSVGTELDNVNRWRRELSLNPIGEGEITSQPVTVDSSAGKLYDLAGQAGRTVVAVIPRNGASWFIKLKGDNATAAAAKPVFMDFLKSIQFGSGAASEPPADSGSLAGSDPHAGLGLQGLSAPPVDNAAEGADSGAPKWNIPAQWTAIEPGPMIFKRFAVPGAEPKANATVSFLEGEGGGLLANVNRWRGQLGLAPVEDGQLDGVTQPVPVAGGNGTMVDFAGASAKTGQPDRLIAIIVPHGGRTWFYKLMGGGTAVAGQKDSFVKFVQTVQYP